MKKQRKWEAYPALAAILEADRLAYAAPPRVNHQGADVMREKAGRVNAGEGFETGPGKIAKHRKAVVGKERPRCQPRKGQPVSDVVWAPAPEAVSHVVDADDKDMMVDVSGAELLRTRLKNRGFRGEHFQVAMGLIEDALRVLIAAYRGKPRIVGAIPTKDNEDTKEFVRETHYWMFLEVDPFGERVFSLEWCIQAINAACDMALTGNSFREEAARLGLYERGSHVAA